MHKKVQGERLYVLPKFLLSFWRTVVNRFVFLKSNGSATSPKINKNSARSQMANKFIEDLPHWLYHQ